MVEQGTIICVDDDRLVLISLRDQLMRVVGDEFEVELAESGEDALDMLEEIQEEGDDIPLIICDQNLPDIQGSELLKKIHQTHPDTRKILLTGETNPDAILQAINQVNLYRYIAKPWDKTDLSLTVREALRSYLQDRQLIEQNRKLIQINQRLQKEIEERELAQAKLIHDALHDSLTGLPNRALLMERITQCLKRRRPSSEAYIAILFIDLDRFKSINDSLGHAVGDQLLIKITAVLKQAIRLGDTVARLGGDEFIILLDGLQSSQDAISIAERILEELSKPFCLKEHTVFSGASIGITVTDDQSTDGSLLIRNADIAMYQAKTFGKSRYVIFDPAMYTQTVELMELEHDLRLALERNEFKLCYQPIIDLTNGQMTNVEALIRWQHPTKGFISPNHFVPVAEDTGLIVPIGAWVLRTACQQLSVLKQECPQANNLKVSVNLACKQLQEGNFIQLLDEALDTFQLTGHSLRLEITESTLMDSSEQMIDILHQLRIRNIQISLDDFGTGYSSLSYLPKLPLDTLKIDQSFVRSMGVEPEDLEIVRTIITLAHTLNMNVIAEGIETSSNVQQLIALGCDLGQGYYFSKPMEFEALMGLFSGLVESTIRSFTIF